MMESHLLTIKSLIGESGFLTNAMALEAGINRTMLKRYCDRGSIERVGRGRYALPDNLVDEYSLLQSSLSLSIFSHETALFFWGMTDRIPHIIELTVPTGANTSYFRQKYPHVQFHYVPQDLLTLGQTQTKSPQGGSVILYDRERCICDLVKNRKKADMQVFSQAIREYFAKKPNIRRLIKYSRALGIEEKIRTYIEVMQ